MAMLDEPCTSKLSARCPMFVFEIVAETIVSNYCDRMRALIIEHNALDAIEMLDRPTSPKTSSESVSLLLRFIGIDRYIEEFLSITGPCNFESRSDSISLTSRTVVNDRPLSVEMGEKRKLVSGDALPEQERL